LPADRSLSEARTVTDQTARAPQPLDHFSLAPARFAAVVEQTGENPIAVALALCYGGHDPDWEHQDWLDTATIEQLANWPRYVLAQTRGEGD
jgi:hypothetical protein